MLDRDQSVQPTGNFEAGIFDIGGVILHIDERPINADIMQTLGIEEAVFQPVWARLKPLLFTGKINEAEYWEMFLRETNCATPLPDRDLFLTEYVKQFSPDQEVLGVVRELRRNGLQLACLTDTMEPHTTYNQGVYAEFDLKVLSDRIGYDKYGPEPYAITLDRLGKAPAQTFMVDDKDINLVIFERSGGRGVLFENAPKLRRDLTLLGLPLS